jgi:hypothetical protein
VAGDEGAGGFGIVGDQGVRDIEPGFPCDSKLPRLAPGQGIAGGLVDPKLANA